MTTDSNPSSLQLQPIGVFHSDLKERYQAPRQPGVVQTSAGMIELHPNKNYEQALEDLEGFQHIWVLFWFHKNQHWKPKVFPPRGEKKRGVFATRSPHRPCPIGFSCLELEGIQGRRIYVSSHDILDETPVLDIKPYVIDSDCFPQSSQGWLEDLPKEENYTLHWSPLAEKQRLYLLKNGGVCIESMVQCQLCKNPYPRKSKRIRAYTADLYELACKTWRIRYQVCENQIFISGIFSGYSPQTLQGQDDPWGDLLVHKGYITDVTQWNAL